MRLGGMDGEEKVGQWGRGRGMEKEEGVREGGMKEEKEEFCMYRLSSIPVQLVQW